MCYHTTFLFSLCGHISISPDPIRDTARCEVALSIQIQSSKLFAAHLASTEKAQTFTSGPVRSPVANRDTSDGPRYSSVTSPFPSPQEFEFAQQAHDTSIPASPTSPRIAQNPQSRPQSDCDRDISALYNDNSLIALKTEEDTSEQRLSPCPIIARHPMHTYILPALCSSCRLSREQNIAKFELQTMKESVDREQWGSRKGAGVPGVINTQRTRIHRRSAGKGKLIPLICVEENRISKEVLNEQPAETESQRRSLISNPGTINESPAYSQLSREPDNDDKSVGAMSTDSTQTWNTGSQDTSTKIAANALALWGRSWWNKSATSAPMSASNSEPPTPLPQTLIHSRPRESEDREPPIFSIPEDSEEIQSGDNGPCRNHSVDVDWTETEQTWKRISSEVKRDLHGRNVNAMEKIMAFDTDTIRAGMTKMNVWIFEDSRKATHSSSQGRQGCQIRRNIFPNPDHSFRGEPS